MLEQIHQILKEKNIFSHQNEGITVATVAHFHEGFALAQEILYKIIDPKTVLYLSGGTTPKTLYEKFAQEEEITPGAVGLVDEQFGAPFHQTSNEKMIRDTGFIRYLQMRGIPFYSILRGESREETAIIYDEKLRTLNATYQKSVAILDIGTDGHTAGLAPNSQVFSNPIFADENKYLLVGEFDDPKSAYKERVTLTFLGLSLIDILVVFVFGDEKKNVLEQLFAQGKEELLPARFFKRPEIAKKTLFITDQRI